MLALLVHKILKIRYGEHCVVRRAVLVLSASRFVGCQFLVWHRKEAISVWFVGYLRVVVVVADNGNAFWAVFG
jgi:hypothetical protein